MSPFPSGAAVYHDPTRSLCPETAFVGAAGAAPSWADPLDADLPHPPQVKTAPVPKIPNIKQMRRFTECPPSKTMMETAPFVVHITFHPLPVNDFFLLLPRGAWP
jgi:hypothetical protein